MILIIFIDGGYSGKDTNRPEYKRMIADLENGRADILIVLKVDRITRARTRWVGAPVNSSNESPVIKVK